MDFHKPTEDQIVKRMSQIVAAEGLQANDATLRELARSSQGDLRLMLGRLQMVRVQAAALTFDEVKVRGLSLGPCGRARAVWMHRSLARLARPCRAQVLCVRGVVGAQNKLAAKDADMSPFECSRKLLDASSTRLRTSERCAHGPRS